MAINGFRFNSNKKDEHMFNHEKDMYCAQCGTQNSVYSDSYSDDYYQGERYYCVSCDSSGQGSPAMSKNKENSYESHVIKAFKYALGSISRAAIKDK